MLTAVCTFCFNRHLTWKPGCCTLFVCDNINHTVIYNVICMICKIILFKLTDLQVKWQIMQIAVDDICHIICTISRQKCMFFKLICKVYMVIHIVTHTKIRPV